MLLVEQVGGRSAGDVTLDLIEDAPAVSVLARAGNTSGVRADLVSGGGRRVLASSSTNAAIAFRALESADIPALNYEAAGAAAALSASLDDVAFSGSAAHLQTGLLPAARFDDTAHGARAGGTTHAVVVAAGAAGFMSGADKTKLDGLAAAGLGIYPALIVDIDYTAQTTATPTLNQTVAYGGLNHTWQRNTGGTELSLADVLNGTGLRLLYKSSGAGSLGISSSVDTAGGVYFLLGDVPGFGESHRYLVLRHIEQRGGVAGQWAVNTYRAVFFHRTLAGTGIYSGIAQNGRGGAWGSATAGVATPFWAVDNGATNGVGRSALFPTTYNVVGTMPIMGGAAMAVYAGIYSGGWPTLESLVLVGVTDPAGGGNGWPPNQNLAITRVGTWLTGAAGVANPHGVDIAHLRVYDMGPTGA